MYVPSPQSTSTASLGVARCPKQPTSFAVEMCRGYVTSADSQVVNEVETTPQIQAPSNGLLSSPRSAKAASLWEATKLSLSNC
ncbi:uncharacterized protein K444DRAFT_100673 [Hyaloscypha bicolor E]|uniref:Uncharacterized protein n=1 Tax=Hyaloscypha bicolor E TaxID=1095630 RepID=A0A2J6SWR0_9HELO|nr:uncharacterized protein K444DRAFT_100673 [Hyaloscypha bicolor E]PMD55208.1 hypothetical protein K444DRAFT_100673 [Hyaloscypha bicolor E]